MPGPAANADVAPPGALAPNLADASAGGGDSTDREMMWAPRTMVKPRVRFSSDSTTAADDGPDPGAAEGLLALRLTRRNSSVSARTRFMCYLSVSNLLCDSLSLTTDLIESEHLSNHLPAIIHGDPHPVIDL
jgi:hypothetical protein